MRRALVSSDVLLGTVRHLQHVSGMMLEQLLELEAEGALDILLHQASADAESEDAALAQKTFRPRDHEKNKKLQEKGAAALAGQHASGRSLISIGGGHDTPAAGSTSFAYPSMGGALTREFDELGDINESIANGSLSPPLLSPATPSEGGDLAPIRRTGRSARKRAGTLIGASQVAANGDAEASAALQKLMSTPNPLAKSTYFGYGSYGKQQGQQVSTSLTVSNVSGGFMALQTHQAHFDRQREAEAALIAVERSKVSAIVSRLSTSLTETLSHADAVFVDWLQKIVTVAQEVQDDAVFTNGTNLGGEGQSAATGDLGMVGSPWDTVTVMSASHQTQASPASCFESILRGLPVLMDLLVQLHNIPSRDARAAENGILTLIYRIVVSLAEFPETFERTVGPEEHLARDYDTATTATHRQSDAYTNKVSFKGLFSQLMAPHLPFLLSASAIQMKAFQRGDVTIRAGPPITLFSAASAVDDRTGLREVIPNLVTLTVSDDYFWVTAFTISVFGGDSISNFLVSRRQQASDEPYQEVLVQSVCACLGYAIKIHCNRIMRLSGLLDELSQPSLPLPAVTVLTGGVQKVSNGRSVLKISGDEAAFLSHMLRTIARVTLQLPIKVHVPTIVGTLSISSWLAMSVAAIDPEAPLPLRYAGDQSNPSQQGPVGPMARMLLQGVTTLASALASTSPESFIPSMAFTGCHQQVVNAVVMLYVAWSLHISHQAPKPSVTSATRSRAQSEMELGARSVRTLSASDLTSESQERPAPTALPSKASAEFQRHQPMLARILIKVLARQDLHKSRMEESRRGLGDDYGRQSGAQKLFTIAADDAAHMHTSCRSFLRAIAEIHHLAKINERRLTNAVEVSKLRSEGGDCFGLLNATLRTALLDSTANVRAASHVAPHSSHHAPLSEVWHVNMWRECLRIATLHSHILSGKVPPQPDAAPYTRAQSGGATSATLSALTLVGGLNRLMRSPSPEASRRPDYDTLDGPFAAMATTVDTFEAFWNLAATALRSMDDTSDGTMAGQRSMVDLLPNSFSDSVGNRMGLQGVSNGRNTYSIKKELASLDSEDWSDYATWMARKCADGGAGGGAVGAKGLISSLSDHADIIRASQHRSLAAAEMATVANGSVCGELVASLRYLNGCVMSAISDFDSDRHVTSHRVCNGFELAAEYLHSYALMAAKTAAIPADYANYCRASAVALYRIAIERVEEEDGGRAGLSPSLKPKVIANLRRRILECDMSR